MHFKRFPILENISFTALYKVWLMGSIREVTRALRYCPVTLVNWRGFDVQGQGDGFHHRDRDSRWQVHAMENRLWRCSQSMVFYWVGIHASRFGFYGVGAGHKQEMHIYGLLIQNFAHMHSLESKFLAISGVKVLHCIAGYIHATTTRTGLLKMLTRFHFLEEVFPNSGTDIEHEHIEQFVLLARIRNHKLYVQDQSCCWSCWNIDLVQLVWKGVPMTFCI